MPEINEGMVTKELPFDTEFEITKQEMEEDKFLVEGLASTSDLDVQGDIITHKALVKAAKDLLKNSTVLFNHDSERPIGRVVKSEAIEGKGLKVTVEVSKGEPEIRLKIEEGILNKFSIRGRAVKTERKFDEAKDQMVFIIHEIRLSEVSLVSVPANPEAKVTNFKRVKEPTKSLAGAIRKSYFILKEEGGDSSMTDEEKKTAEEKAAADKAKQDAGAEGGGEKPAEGGGEKPAEGSGEKPAEETKPEGGEAPAAGSPEAPAEGGEKPAEEGGEKPAEDSEKSLRRLGQELATASGSELDRIKGEMSKILTRDEEVKKAAAEVITQEQVNAMVEQKVKAALAGRKAEVDKADGDAGGAGDGSVKKGDIPKGNKLVYLIAKKLGREGDLR